MSGRKGLAQLRNSINKYFDEDDLRTLCFDLGIDYDDLTGNKKSAKARELIIECEKSGRLDELIELCSNTRPNSSWGILQKETIKEKKTIDSIDVPENPSLVENYKSWDHNLQLWLIKESSKIAIGCSITVTFSFIFIFSIWPMISNNDDLTPTAIAVNYTSTATPILLPSNTPTLTLIPTQSTNTPSPTDTPVPTNTVVPTPTASATICPSPQVRATSKVNVRSGPGVIYDPPIAVMNTGDMASVIASDLTGSWYNVQLDGIRGWVHISRVELLHNKICGEIPVAATIPPPPPTDTPTPVTKTPTAPSPPSPIPKTPTPASPPP